MSEPSNTQWWDQFTRQLKTHWLEIAVSSAGVGIGVWALVDQMTHRSAPLNPQNAEKTLTEVRTIAGLLKGR